MSQSKVNSFFLQRKGIRDGHAAKRRKIDGSFKNLEMDDKSAHGKESQQTESVAIPTLSLSEGKETKLTSRSENQFVVNGENKLLLSAKKSSPLGRKTRSRSSKKNAGNTKSSNSQFKLYSQQKLTDFQFSPVPSTELSSKPCSPESVDVPVFEKDLSNTHTKAYENKPELKSTECHEEITSVSDDHVNLSQVGMSTPRKRIITVEQTLSQGPLSRRRKTAIRKIKNETDDLLVSPRSGNKTVDICKRLNLGNETTETERPKSPQFSVSDCDSSDSKQIQNEEPINKSTDLSSLDKPCEKSDLLAAVSEISESRKAISPLAMTPEHLPSSPSPPIQSSSPQLQTLSEKLQVLSKMNGKALKNRLKQKGLLDDCKQKLGILEKAVSKNEILKSSSSATAPLSSENVEIEKKALPAYQRFDYLTKEGVPTLSLPYAYRLLENAFLAMDTAVCMLHNRSEICTFSKLKSAVQIQTRKNFEQKTVGQIKTVVPDAYLIRQEKNLPTYGQKASGYQLTIEANIHVEDKKLTNFTKDGKPSFSVKLIQKRKEYFKHRLLNIVKQHHKKFLESLNPPLNIPDNKLSRWHPKFHLDEVPSIPAADLPQSPDLKVVRSAKDVLEIIKKGKVISRVEQALQRVVAENEASTKSNTKENSNLSKDGDAPSSPAPSCSKQTTSSLKGIPPSLLAKIRAKEALKMEEALTRDPAEERKTAMLGHLPEIIRILRSYFVTEKKPALPLAAVFKKLGDSYKSGMAIGDIEQHVNLLKELAPEFISVVEVQKGKYLKLDKNVDTTAVSSRITNLVKSRQ